MQDFYDIIQPFDYMVDLFEQNKQNYGIKYIAENDEDLIPEYPAILVQASNLEREHHATQMFRVVFFLEVWILHAELSVGKAVRSRKDIELATDIRKLIHSKRTMDGHIIDSYVSGEFAGIAARVVGSVSSTIVTTRLTWEGQNRVRFQDS